MTCLRETHGAKTRRTCSVCIYVIVNIRDQLHGFLWLCFSCWMMETAYHRPMIRTSPARVGRVHCVMSHDRRVPTHLCAHCSRHTWCAGTRWPVIFPCPATTKTRYFQLCWRRKGQHSLGQGWGKVISRAKLGAGHLPHSASGSLERWQL